VSTALLTNVSIETSAISAVVSVVTGYVGTPQQFRRQRDRARRTHWPVILAEIKSLQRVSRRYHGVLGIGPVDFGPSCS
jgi:TPP-dependent indolepyruvate ferredoxin oxidoreductase alpha subunit